MGHVQLRRARMRGLKEGKIQTARIEATENDSKDAVERHQDYGFAGNPVDGEGLVLHIDGHTVIIRKDRIAERPQLDPYEVSVWHKEGHKMTFKAGKLIEVECDRFVLKAAQSVEIETPQMLVKASGKLRVESPLHEMNGLMQTQQLTIGLTGPGTATMNGGTINYNGVQFNLDNCVSTATGGSFTHDGRNVGGSHVHPETGATTAIPNP
jgi:phage gp45-like